MDNIIVVAVKSIIVHNRKVLIAKRTTEDKYGAGIWIHQTRTPLTIIRTHLEGIEDGVDDVNAEMYYMDEFISGPELLIKYPHIHKLIHNVKIEGNNGLLLKNLILKHSMNNDRITKTKESGFTLEEIAKAVSLFSRLKLDDDYLEDLGFNIFFGLSIEDENIIVDIGYDS